MKKILNNKISNLIKVLIAVLALFLFNIDARAEITFSQNYDYTGGEQVLTVPYSGLYKLETWGAQGGSINNSILGGYGAYSTGKIKLNKGEKLYINVGGEGACYYSGNTGTSHPGTYNGGGGTRKNTESPHANNYTCSGGGATHIATESGLLSTFDSKRDKVIIVSAGGGGAYWYTGSGPDTYSSSGGSGGGIIGGSPTPSDSTIISLPDQTNPGVVNRPDGYVIISSFGQGTGGPSPAGEGTTLQSSAGGGGGWYGGVANPGATGGSSYIGNSNLTDKYMVCLNCEESSDEQTKTIKTTILNSTATSDQVKANKGYAKITMEKYYPLLSTMSVDESKGYLKEDFEPSKTDYTWVVYKGINELTADDIIYEKENSADEVILPNGPVEFTQNGDTFEIIVFEPGNEERTTYTLTMERYVSNDGRLSSLSSDKGLIKETFDPDNKNYTLEIFDDSNEVTLTAIPNEQDNQGIVYSYAGDTEYNTTGVIPLTDDESDVKIASMAEDGTIEIYNVHIIRNMYLKNIEVKGLENLICDTNQCTINPSFIPEREEYTITVPQEYENLELGYEPSQPHLMVNVKVNDADYRKNMALSRNQNTVKFNIYNNSHNVVKTYTLNIIKDSDNNRLKSLSIVDGKGYLKEDFNKNIYDYTWVIPKGTTTVYEEDIIAKTFNSKVIPDIPSSVMYHEDGDKIDIIVKAQEELDYSYSEHEEVFTAPYTGTYKLETWGAQGGSINNNMLGGYGAYSTGTINLNEGDKLYINVGGTGACYYSGRTGTSHPGTYNGGGGTRKNTESPHANNYTCSGGGATHIATESGLLSTFNSNRDKVVLVSAGGGGAYWYTGSGPDTNSFTGGSGGGIIGGSPTPNDSAIKSLPNQTNPGVVNRPDGYVIISSFGQGTGGPSASGEGTTLQSSAGAGGGWYGGVANAGATGGSSYIANSELTDKHITCYSCIASNEESTKTIATTLRSVEPKADYAKSGAGYAKITLLDAPLATRTYTLTLEMEKSDDARLATLTATTPTSEPNFPNGFDKDQTDPVIIEVYNNVFEITLDGTPYEQDATVIDGLGTIELNEDEVEHNITVQAENGDIRVYQVIIRKNMYIEDMGLTSTSLEGKACKAGECVLEPTFDPGTTEYFIKVPVDYDNLYAYYSLPDTHHTSVMTVDGNPYVDGYELPVEGTVVVKVDVYNDDPNNNQVVKTYTMRVIKEVEYQQEFDYTGDYQVFIAPFTGKYKMETWGAQGANLNSGSGGKGAYASGYIELQKGEKLYVYVGEGGINALTTRSYGELSFNGGSGGNYACVTHQPNSPYNYYGGSATDIRLKPGDSATDWDNQASLASRIMVASGGSASNGSTAGAPGGTINGIAGSGGTTGGTQTASGGPNTGGFGYAGTPSYNPVCDRSVTSGAGSGYYGGGATNKTGINFGNNVSASGSSFISGYPGVIAITSEDDLTPKTGDDKNIHYSGKRFENAIMLAGNEEMPTHDGTGTMTGNSGDGYAKITYIPEIENRIDFDYTGDYQEFIAPTTGIYKMETWGAQGANLNSGSGGKGAYASGYIELQKGEKLYVYVGEGGINALTTRSYGELSFNGGSGGNYACVNIQPNVPYNYYGGSATDIRLVEGNWNSFDSLKSRIMVASGGSASNGSTAGAPGGTINGIAGSGGTTGGTQTASGGPKTGGFGYAGTPSYNPVCDNSVTSGAGSGYYGGGATNKTGTNFGNNVSASGSSFISGHTGVNAIAENSTESNIIHTGQANHYSGKVFTDTVMKAGNELMPSPDGVTSQVGNIGDGHAAITLIEVEVKLDDLTVDYGALTESFDKNKNDYVWQIPKDTEYIDKEDIHYVPSNPDSTVTDTLPIDEVHNGDVIEITVTGDDGVTTNVYTLTVEYIKDTDNRLRTLESDKGVFTPEFNPDTNSYVLEIYEYLDEVTLTGEPMSEYSTVVGLGTIDMEEDIVEHEIIVTAEDGSINIYNVTIKKDAYLLYLGLNGLGEVPCVEDECTLVPPFEPSSNEYSIKVPYEYETLDVYYLTSTPEHSVKIKVNDSEVSNYSLPESDTLVTVELYNKNNILVNTYTMNVNRAKGNYATLDNLEVSTGDLNISFDRETTEYTWIIPFDVNNNLEDYLTYSTTDPGATAELIPSTINYTGDGQTFDIKVTAEDGVTTKTYTITLQQDIIEDIEVDENMFITVGETKNLYINGLPDGCVGKYLYEVDQSAIIYVYDNGDVFGIFPGEADITISVKNHPEITPKVVHVTVVSNKITSSILDVLDKDLARIIIGEEPGVNISDFLDKLDNPREYLEVYDKDDNLISSDDYGNINVKTGIKVKLVINDVLHDEAIIIIRGDINEDGLVNVIDKSILSEHVLRLNNIEGYKTYAADVDNNDSINITDKSKLSEYILRLIDTLNE